MNRKISILLLMIAGTMFAGSAGFGIESTNVSQIALDVHVHAFSPFSWRNAISAQDIIKVMDDARVERAVVISAGYFEGPWHLFLWTPFFGRSEERVRTENDYVASLVRRYPDRLIGACGVHPFDKWTPGELDRCTTKLGMRVVKVHPNAQRLDLSDEKERQRLRSFFDLIGKSKAVALVHAFGKTLEFQKNLVSIAVSSSNTVFIFAHMFGDHFPDVVDSVAGANNIYVDISGTVLETKNPTALVQAMRKFGMNRVLFGSDYPVATPKESLNALKKLPLSALEVATILQNEGPFALQGVSSAKAPLGRGGVNQ